MKKNFTNHYTLLYALCKATTIVEDFWDNMPEDYGADETLIEVADRICEISNAIEEIKDLTKYGL